DLPTRTRLRLPVPALLAGIQSGRRRDLDRHRRLHRPSHPSIFCTDMNLPSPASRADNGPGYPRYFRIAGQWINSYTVFLCVGIYLGILVIAALAQSSGMPPLRVGPWLTRARDHRSGRRESVSPARLPPALFWKERLSKRVERQRWWLEPLRRVARDGSLFLRGRAPARHSRERLLRFPGRWHSRGRLLGAARLRVQWLLRRPGNARLVRRVPARHPRRAPTARPRTVSGNGLVAPRRHRVHLALAQILPAGKLRAGRPGVVWTGSLFPGTPARSPGSHRWPRAHQSMRRRRTRLGRRRRFAGEGIRIVSRVCRQRRRTDFPGY